jgi:hypothetical protein
MSLGRSKRAKDDDILGVPGNLGCPEKWDKRVEGIWHKQHFCKEKATPAHTVHRCTCGDVYDERNPS